MYCIAEGYVSSWCIGTYGTVGSLIAWIGLSLVRLLIRVFHVLCLQFMFGGMEPQGCLIS